MRLLCPDIVVLLWLYGGSDGDGRDSACCEATGRSEI